MGIELAERRGRIQMHQTTKEFPRRGNEAFHFRTEKTFEGFDFRFNAAAFPQALLRDLATCAFMDLGQNVVIAGPPGIGKTHLAKALGHEACRRKRHVLYKNVYDMFGELSRARTDAHYERLLGRIIKSDLLIVDDFALRKFETKEVEMLYSIVDAREDTKSVILTSNRPCEDWLNVFPDPVVGGAILDRLISGAIKIIVKSAKSFRKEGSDPQALKPQNAKTDVAKNEKLTHTQSE